MDLISSFPHIPKPCPEEMELYKIQSLLSQIRFRNNRTLEIAERAIQMLLGISEYLKRENITFLHTMPRGLVFYPHLLRLYLTVLTIDQEDLKSMICRCIESPIQQSPDNYETRVQSLEILLSLVRLEEGLNILLLPGRYDIDLNLYYKSRDYGVRDIYFEESLKKNPSKNLAYIHPVIYANSEFYFGYRNTYHALLYAGEKCQVLIPEFRKYPDCQVEAAMDFFKIPYDGIYSPEKEAELIKQMTVQGYFDLEQLP